MLHIENVSKRYGKTLANDGVSFAVESGELAVLLGPNGAGKSTLIKCIAGLLRFEGNIEICGHGNKTLEAKRALGYIPEMPAVYELLALRRYRKGLLKYIQSEDALAAALYRHHAEYVVNNNLLELSGQGMTDMIGSLRKLADVMYGMDIDDAEYESPAEQREMNCISMPSGQPFRKKLFLLP